MFNESQGTLADLISKGNLPEEADHGVLTSVFEYLTLIAAAAVFMMLLLRDKKSTSITA